MATLKISGEVGEALSFSAEELAGFAPEEKVADVRELGAKRDGAGVHLQAILSRVKPKPTVRYITLIAPADDFSASIPIDRVAETAVVVHSIGGEPMSRAKGGPFRFIIPDSAACHTDEIDDCANVKFLEEIQLSEAKGRDTRPDSEERHRALHEEQENQADS